MDAVWTVTAADPGRYFEWQTGGLGLKTIAGHGVGNAGNGTSVTLSVAWSGFLAPLIRLLDGRLSRGYAEMEAQGLKRRCETSIAASS